MSRVAQPQRAYPKALSSSHRRGGSSNAKNRCGRNDQERKPFVSQGLLNLEHRSVKKAKEIPPWMAEMQAKCAAREGFVANPRYRTASEMRRARSLSMMPDASNDVDGDGAVSAEDLRIAKKFDTNYDGILQPKELHALRVDLVSEAFTRIRRMQKAGQIGAHNPAVESAVTAFADMHQAVDGPEFNRKLRRLRACIDIGGKDSVQVRELINPSREMRGMSSAGVGATTVATPKFLHDALAAAARAAEPAPKVAEAEPKQEATPRTLELQRRHAERARCSNELAALTGDVTDRTVLGTDRAPKVGCVSKTNSGYKTYSELVRSRRLADAAQAEHMNDFERFGNDFYFPNSRKEKAKRKTERSRRRRRAGSEDSDIRKQQLGS